MVGLAADLSVKWGLRNFFLHPAGWAFHKLNKNNNKNKNIGRKEEKTKHGFKTVNVWRQSIGYFWHCVRVCVRVCVWCVAIVGTQRKSYTAARWVSIFGKDADSSLRSDSGLWFAITFNYPMPLSDCSKHFSVLSLSLDFLLSFSWLLGLTS